jgi:hypothetical protein
MIHDLEPYGRELNDARDALHHELQVALGGAAPMLLRAIERFVDAAIELSEARRQS